MSSTCVHIVDGFCVFWKYETTQGFFKIVDDALGEGYYRRLEDGSWVFRAERFYCKNCPSYRRKGIH